MYYGETIIAETGETVIIVDYGEQHSDQVCLGW